MGRYVVVAKVGLYVWVGPKVEPPVFVVAEVGLNVGW